MKILKTILSVFIVLFLTTQNTEVLAQENFGGLALYTVRDAMKADAKGTLKAVADAGYTSIEAAGYADGKFYGMEPSAFKAYLKKVGLKPVSTHHSSVTLDNADQMIADVKAAGFKYFVIPIPPMGQFTYDAATNTLGMTGTVENLSKVVNTLGKKCTAAGLKLLYHNHDFEFMKNDKGIVPIEYLLEHSDPKHVNFQMDLFWVTKAGADPIKYFDQYPGRFKAWHVKDMDEKGRFAPVGQGKINFTKILKHKKTSGMEHYFVEQDMTFDDLKPLEAIKISHKALAGIGFN